MTKMNTKDLVDISKKIYLDNKDRIDKRVNSFNRIGKEGTNEEIFFELVYCILAAGTSAELAFKVHKILKKDRFVILASKEEIVEKLRTCYRFYNLRGTYIYQTRQFLQDAYYFNLRDIINTDSPDERRNFFVEKPEIIGVGMKVASHFLRNIGFNDYAILDKHLIKIMKDFNLISESAKIPISRNKYLEYEDTLKEFSKKVDLTMGELDFVLWYHKTGKIIK